MGEHALEKTPVPGKTFGIYPAPPARYELRPMSAILDLVQTQQRQRFEAGEIVITQNGQSRLLYVLIDGEVEVLRDEVRVAKVADPGAVFGEMAALLGGPHTATVRALRASTFALIENPREFLRSSPDASLHVAELLARRLDRLNKYLIDVKRQYEGHDHLGMVDEVLEALMHRQPRVPR
jgi:CRP-like cAMP-binding protein